jgi:hypothetical protein
VTRQLGILLAAFAGGALVAGILGAGSLGIALGVGQLCFAGALAWALIA